MNNKNMVDERFELISLIFRLAKKEPYGIIETDYHKKITETFKIYTEHPAVELIKSFSWACYHCAPKFIVHLEKEKKDGRFVFIEDINSLFDIEGNWDETTAKNFLMLFNDFYVETDYFRFFNSQKPLFEEATQKFIYETYSKIDFEWFEKYTDPSNLRCIYSLSSGNYATTVNNKIIYCVVWKKGGALIHEYCHHLADRFVDKWYNENQEFKKWCDDSVNLEKLPYYNNGWIMANEYITRAFDILYQVEHGTDVNKALLKEKNSSRDNRYINTFPYIEDVYKMVLGL